MSRGCRALGDTQARTAGLVGFLDWHAGDCIEIQTDTKREKKARKSLMTLTCGG